MIYKIGFEFFGEGEMVVDSSDCFEYENVKDLVKSDSGLEDYIFEKLNNNIAINKDDILNWYNSDEDVLTCCKEADSEVEFLKNFTTMDELKSCWISENTIYIFRNYQHSKNVLLAKFVGFSSVDAVKCFCIEKEINYSEFQGGQFNIYEFNNCYFKRDIDEFRLEEIEAIKNAEEIDTFELEN